MKIDFVKIENAIRIAFSILLAVLGVAGVISGILCYNPMHFIPAMASAYMARVVARDW